MLKGVSNLTQTPHHHYTNTTPPRHKHFSAFTISLHRFVRLSSVIALIDILCFLDSMKNISFPPFILRTDKSVEVRNWTDVG